MKSSPTSQAVVQADPQTVVIVTALDVETKAVLRQLDGDWTDEAVDGTVCYRGRFENWEVAIVEAGPGNASTAVLADRLINRYRPDVALFVGVGGGIKDVKLGDVVVASKVYGYESGKDTAGGFKERPDLNRSAHLLEQRARALCKRNEWRKRLNPDLTTDKEPDLFVGPIAAGEKVVASQRSATAKLLKKHYSDAIAVEMEGKGFLEAAHVSSVVATVVRGVSDLLSGKAASDGAGWQKRAADAASSVAFEILSKIGDGDPNGAPRPAVPAKDKGKPTKVAASVPRPRGLVSDPMAMAKPPNADGIREMLQARKPFLETKPTLNEGSFFDDGEVLARIGVPNVDEVRFLFSELPDGFVRVIPRHANAQPIPVADLLQKAADAPLLKHRQYGGFTSLNARGVLAYDPGGPHRGGHAPLAWGTQLFRNGELWLASNTVVIRERGERPVWVPIPFIPALLTEQIFYEKTFAAVEFAVAQLGLAFPCDLELGVLGLKGVMLAVRDDDIRGPIQSDKVVARFTLTSANRNEIDGALLGFFNELYDATGYARTDGLFGFPPGPPRP